MSAHSARMYPYSGDVGSKRPGALHPTFGLDHHRKDPGWYVDSSISYGTPGITIDLVEPAASAVMDLLCVVLPIFFLRNLQAKIGRKISLFVLLGLGLL